MSRENLFLTHASPGSNLDTGMQAKKGITVDVHGSQAGV